MNKLDSQSVLESTWQEIELAAQEGDHKQVLILLKQLDKLGIWRATARIGELYETGGVGLSADPDEAVKWYRKAVFESDDPIAHLGLGRIYYTGSISVERDFTKARNHLEKSFNLGIAQAGIFLGLMSMFGVDSKENMPEAKRLFLVAAKGGFPIAYRYLANIAASSGHLLLALRMLMLEFFCSLKLKIQDKNHPNLWKLPK